jgi:prepilin-type N-terminal cleavage/methylation domain-containing protein
MLTVDVAQWAGPQAASQGRDHQDGASGHPCLKRLLISTGLQWCEKGYAMAKGRGGFTLIEVSVVLVIIGLIAGAVLLGRDLIGVATIRATVSQIQKYEAAVNTFRTKYNYLPGDIPAGQAMQTGLIARGGGEADGDGNGLIEGLGGFSSYTLLGGETVFVWTDLSSAGLIDGSFTDSTDAPINCHPCDMSLYLPKAKTGRNGYVFAGYFFNAFAPLGGGAVKTFSGLSFEVFGAQSPQNSGGGAFSISAGLTVMEAYSIDTKIDDGLPNAGNVEVGTPAHAGNWNGLIGELAYFILGTGDQFCVLAAGGPSTDNPYNLAYPDSVSCNLIIDTRL